MGEGGSRREGSLLVDVFYGWCLIKTVLLPCSPISVVKCSSGVLLMFLKVKHTSN